MNRRDRQRLQIFRQQLARIRQLRHPLPGHSPSCQPGGATDMASMRVFHLEATRPWTADCLLNLQQNVTSDWPAERTAAETRRSPNEVRLMTAMIRLYGFEHLHRLLLRKELKLGASEEIQVLQYLGIVS